MLKVLTIARISQSLPAFHLMDERLKCYYKDNLLPNETGFMPFQPLFRKFIDLPSKLPIFNIAGDDLNSETIKFPKKEELDALEKLPKIFHRDHVDYVIGSQVLNKVGQNWYYHGFLSFHHNHHL